MTSTNTIPPIVKASAGSDTLHVFFLQNPVATIMSLMIADAYNLPRDQCFAVSIRHTDTQFTGFATLPLVSKKLDRYVSKLSGRNMAGTRLRRTLERTKRNYIVYASWHYPEVEEATLSPTCLGTVIFEEGQLSYYLSQPYQNSPANRWLHRRKKIAAGQLDYYFPSDADAFVAFSSEAFPAVRDEKRHVLKNMAAAARNYVPQLSGIDAVGLMPAPRRLAPSDVMPAIDTLISAMPGPAVIKMHPGYMSERYYSAEEFSAAIEQRSSGRVALCPDGVLLELEMLARRKTLYGARTSLSRYARMFGSDFRDVAFDNYIEPII